MPYPHAVVCAADANLIQPNLPIEALTSEVQRLFAERFGRDPEWVAAAPGRVNLIGEHTDYNGGRVLPLAIQRYTLMAAARGQKHVRLCTTAHEGMAEFSATGPLEPGDPPWSNYVRGVVAGFAERGHSPGPFDAMIHSSLPLGGGLSSSAALEVVTAVVLESLTGATLEPREKAELCQAAEHRFAGVPCGIMDPYTAIMGEADALLLLDCLDLEARHVPFTDPGVCLLVSDTGVKHDLSTGAYAERRAECSAAAKVLGVEHLCQADMARLEAAGADLNPLLTQRAQHVISEHERTLQAAEASEARDWQRVGALMNASHASLKDAFEVSCPELDLLAETAQALGPDSGVFGSRMTGGGFGGCTVSLVRQEAVEAVAEQMARCYLDGTGRALRSFVTRPAAGAHRVYP